MHECAWAVVKGGRGAAGCACGALWRGGCAAAGASEGVWVCRVRLGVCECARAVVKGAAVGLGVAYGHTTLRTPDLV